MSDLKRAGAYFRKAQVDLREARVLLNSEFPDGVCNRAYYALFDCILSLLHTTDGPIPKTHTGAHTEFRRQFIQAGLFPKTYSDIITELFNLRQGGDYEIDFDISLEDAHSALTQATEFFQQTEAYLRSIGYNE